MKSTPVIRTHHAWCQWCDAEFVSRSLRLMDLRTLIHVARHHRDEISFARWMRAAWTVIAGRGTHA